MENDLIVSMHETRSYTSKKELWYAAEKFENNCAKNTSATLIFENKPQAFFANRKTGFVINPKSVDVHFGGTYQKCATYGKVPKLIRKGDWKINSNNPNKLVYQFGAQTTTDYTRYDVSTKEVYPERTNEKALQLYTKAIKHKNNKKEGRAECGELLVSKKKDYTNSAVLGLIIDITEGVPEAVKDLKSIINKNANFNLYIFNKGKINVIENNKQNFLDKLERYSDSYTNSSCFIKLQEKEPLEDFISKSGKSLTKHNFNLNIESILNKTDHKSVLSSNNTTFHAETKNNNHFTKTAIHI